MSVLLIVSLYKETQKQQGSIVPALPVHPSTINTLTAGLVNNLFHVETTCMNVSERIYVYLRDQRVLNSNESNSIRLNGKINMAIDLADVGPDRTDRHSNKL